MIYWCTSGLFSIERLDRVGLFDLAPYVLNHQVMELQYLDTVIRAEGSLLDLVVNTTVLVTDVSNFS
ncbi:MAG: hypothetical protein JWQ42_2374 [Edaphobacter sp.]|nr:hypothetical protein [Edaphobacter sp.]